MNIQRIEYFLVAAKEKSLTKASTKIFISHQALSKQILLLEKDLGVKLFVRSNNGLTLTPAGIKFQQTFQPLVSSITEKYDSFCNQIQQCSKQLRIGYFNGFSFSNIVQPYINRLKTENPGLDISFEADDLNHLELSLDRDEVDVVLTVHLGGNESAKYDYRFISESPLNVYISEKHPLFEKTNITKEDLMNHSLLIHSNRPAAGKDSFASDVQVKNRIICKNYSTFKAYLNQGLGFAIIGDGAGPADTVLKSFPLPVDYDNASSIVAISKKTSVHRNLLLQ